MIKFLLKGLFRDRSRSLFPVLMVSGGAFLTVFFYCWMNGAVGDIVDINARFDTGHVKVVTRAYDELADQVPNDLALLGVTGLLEQLRDSRRDMLWTPRTRFGGLIDVPDQEGYTRAQGPVSGLGVDLLRGSPEIRILNLKDAIVRGALPEVNNEILVSEEFADKLGIKIGETVTLLSSTMNGAMAMHNFVVAGTVYFGIAAMDRGAIIVDIRDIQTALDMPDGAGEILGFSPDMVYSDNEMISLKEKFNAEYSKEKDEFSPIMMSLGEQNELGEYLMFARVAGGIIVSIFVFAMSIVLWNSGLINGIRRYGEVGVRLAMGEPKGSIYLRMIFESIIIGLMGSMLGTLIGLGVSFYLQYKGVDFGDMLQRSGMLISNIIRARVTGPSYIIGFLPGLIASVLGTMFAGIGIYRRRTAQLFKELEA